MTPPPTAPACSLQGLFAVMFTSVPAAINLILLLRMEAQTGEGFKTMKGLDTAEVHRLSFTVPGS